MKYKFFGIVTLCLQGGAAGVGRRLVAVGNDNFGPGFRERFGAGKPDALAGSGHERGLVVQLEFFQIHVAAFPVGMPAMAMVDPPDHARPTP